MIEMRPEKWGRGMAAFICVFLCILLCACGSDDKNAASDVSDEKAAVSEAPSDGGIDPSIDPLERLSGKYYIDGDVTGACVRVNADGSFTAYYASGTAEQTGYVRYEADDTGEKTFYVYVFYTDEGKPYMGFVDSGESRISEFETGNGSYRYVRVD